MSAPLHCKIFLVRGISCPEPVRSRLVSGSPGARTNIYRVESWGNFFNPPPISLPPEPPPFLSVLASNKFDLARLPWWHRFSLSPSPIPRWGPNGRPRAWGCWWWSCTSCPRWRRRSGRSWSRCWSPWGCSGGAPPTNSPSSERTQADEPSVDR